MSLVVEQPQVPTPAALRDEPSGAVDGPEVDVVEVEIVGYGPSFEPPSDLLLTAASLAVWLGMAIAVRRLLTRRLARR